MHIYILFFILWAGICLSESRSSSFHPFKIQNEKYNLNAIFKQNTTTKQKNRYENLRNCLYLRWNLIKTTTSVRRCFDAFTIRFENEFVKEICII